MNLRFKYFQKKYFIWQDSEFIRDVRNNAIISKTKFECRKITAIEQEDWFTEYSKKDNYHIWIIYDEDSKRPIGYLTIEIESIKHRRIRFDYNILPKFDYLKADKKVIKWIISKSKNIELDVHKVWCYVLESDEVRLKKLNNNGIKIEAFLPEFVYKSGEYLNVYISSIFVS